MVWNAVGRGWVTLAKVSGWYVCHNRAVGLQKKQLQWTRECAYECQHALSSPVTDSRTKQSSDLCFTAARKRLLFCCHRFPALHQSAAFLVCVSSVLLTLTKLQRQSSHTLPLSQGETETFPSQYSTFLGVFIHHHYLTRNKLEAKIPSRQHNTIFFAYITLPGETHQVCSKKFLWHHFRHSDCNLSLP